MDRQSRGFNLLQKALQNDQPKPLQGGEDFDSRSLSSTPESEASLSFCKSSPQPCVFQDTAVQQYEQEFAVMQPLQAQSDLEDIASQQLPAFAQNLPDGFFLQVEQRQLSPFVSFSPHEGEIDGTPLLDEHSLQFQPNNDAGLNHGDNSLDDPEDSLDDSSGESEQEPDTRPGKKRKLTKHQKLVHEREKHQLLPPCGNSCRRKCSEHLDHQTRTQMWEEFWSEETTLQARRNFLQNSTTRTDKAASTNVGTASRRQKSISWSLSGNKVCKIMFLHTLGFTSDAAIRSLFHAHDRLGTDPAFGAPGDGRGGHKTKRWFADEFKDGIRDFVETFRPACSHYRIAHAPNRRYLPSHLTVAEMFRKFCESQRQKGLKVCSYRSFFKIFQTMNIAFNQPQADKCSKCEEHDHAHDGRKHDCEECGCDECSSFMPHRIAAAEARLQMESDIKNKTPDTLIITCDMQKVLLLPQLATKDWFFSQKLVLLNETFAEPGKNGSCYTLLWHEGECGRRAEDVASAYVQFLKKAQKACNASQIVIFTDNCGAQNKNKVLFTALVMAINDPEVNASTITIRYLEPGHTFMAADSVHGSITKAMKGRESIYDYADFKELISTSRHRLTVIEMDHRDKYEFPNAFKQSNDDLIFADIRVIQFSRGSASIFVKSNHTDEQFREIKPFTKKHATSFGKLIKSKKSILQTVAKATAPRGISAAKKVALVNLAKSMPLNRRGFYSNLPTANDIKDLEVELEEDDYDIEF